VRQFHVDVLKAGTVVALLVQYADQIHDRVASLKVLMQRRLVMHVGLDQLDCRQHEQLPMAFAPAREYSDLQALLRQAIDEVTPDETGAP
jgi:hypothetical protein